MRTLVNIVCGLITGLAILLGCQTTGGQPVPAAGGDIATPPLDVGWPRHFSKDDQTISVHQPQVDDWKDYEVIHFRAAVELVPKGTTSPRFGIISVEARTDTDPVSRTVVMHDGKVEVRFPNVSETEEARLTALVTDALPQRRPLTISLDRVLSCIQDSAAVQRSVPVDMNPPPIFHSESPAVLIMFMGAPEFQPIPDTRLMFAVNTNWDVFLDTQSNRYYLLNQATWLTAPDPVKGPWTAAQALPQDMARLPASDPNWNDVRKALAVIPARDIPRVFVSTGPAELLVTQGAPKFSPISGTSLMYVSNTDSPLFLHTQEQNYYYLVAGRWFRAKSLDGPWTSATTTLPADFARIPDDSPMQYVVVCVPGTEDARDAVLLASIPQRATVSRSDLTLTVTYQGQPQFAPIEGTTLLYAVNSPNEVIKVDSAYYCCANGVWFQSAAPAGPWIVCTSVPGVIYTIPVTSPVHNVTYVRIYSYTPDLVVVGYTGGYTGQYVASGVVMFGAGVIVGAALANNYHYNTVFYSYGCAAVYHGYYGGYFRAATVYGPYGGAGRAAYYNPATGTWARGAYAYGPAGSIYARQAYNPQTGIYRAQAGGTSPYGSWSRGVIAKGDDWVAGGKNSGAYGTVGWAETSGGRSIIGAQGARGGTVISGNQDGAAVRTASGDIYAGRDGNVYRRQDGQWQKNDGSGWTNPLTSAGRGPVTPRGAGRAGLPAVQLPANLNRDSQARITGNLRTTRTMTTRTVTSRAGRGR